MSNKKKKNLKTYNNQSTAKSREMSFVGSPKAPNTNNIVTNAELGILAAPILANVAVILKINLRTFNLKNNNII